MTAVHSTTVIFFYVQLIACVTSQPQGCPSGYFGTSYKYKCRCTRDMCEVNGSCLGGDTCLPGWFGPACQYADIANGQPAGNYLTDGEDRTCEDYTRGTGNVTLILPESYPFTWLRVHVNSTEAVSNLQVTFNDTVSCNNPRSAPVDDQTWDIYCSMDEFVQSVTLTGPAASSLCSIYISGGRDVAINENAQQTSTWSVYPASLSVDGNVNPDFFAGKTCSSTLGYPSTPDSWNVTFSRARIVNRYAIYNKADGNNYRLQGFSLQSFYGSTRVFNYTNNQEILPVYTVKHGHLHMSFVQMTSGSIDNILQMCEMEIYGDSICADGQYGRECEHTCNCDGGQPCFVSTGGCPSGCASGYQGENCKIPCSPGKYGLGCLTNCSEFCTRDITGVRSCDRFNGTCNLGCEDGYRGSNCTLPCAREQYGRECNNTCSQQCAKQTGEETSCDHVNGTCRFGCQAGYKEPLCLTSCEAGKYGPGCGYNCSSICVASNTTDLSACHHVTGVCMFGCHGGYDAMICDPDYGSPAGPDNGQLIGLIVGCLFGVIIVAVIIAAGIILFRRRQATKFKTHGDESRDISLPRNDRSETHRSLSGRCSQHQHFSAAGNVLDGDYEIPELSTAVTQRATQIGAQRATQIGAQRATQIGAQRATQIGAQRATQIGPQRATQIGAQRKVESEDIVGDDSVAHTCDDSVAHTYEEIGDNLASPYETVGDGSIKDITHNCPEYANTL